MKINLVTEIECDVRVEFITKELLDEHKNKKTLKNGGFKAEQDSICFLHSKKKLICGVDDFENDNIRSARHL